MLLKIVSIAGIRYQMRYTETELVS